MDNVGASGSPAAVCAAADYELYDSDRRSQWALRLSLAVLRTDFTQYGFSGDRSRRSAFPHPQRL